MKVYVAQCNPTVGDISGNTAKIIAGITAARKAGATLAVFPELAICGYPPEDLVYNETCLDSQARALSEIASHTKGMMVVVGFVRRNLSRGEKGLCNSAAVIQDGSIIGYYDKWLLPTYDLFDERRYFEPGNELGTWEWQGKKIAVLICEDIWQHGGYVEYTYYENDPVRELCAHKPDLVVNISASPYQFGKETVRKNVCRKTVKTLKCPLILCCQVGGNGQILFDGGSIVMNADQEIVAYGDACKEVAILADPFADSKKELQIYPEMKELFDALVLGVRDYFAKTGFAKACLGLSGGIDSAVVAVIATAALGKENVYALLMPSQFSSEGSILDAKKLAENLSIKTETIAIESAYKVLTDLLQPLFKGLPLDITEENLQARIRGTLLMSLANKKGFLNLATSNKSELALGYSTLYGDMCGSLSVLGDVKKTTVYALALYINRDEEIIPESTLSKPPSAELRPDQKDSDTLPPYELLDTIIEGYVENELSVTEVIDRYSLPYELVKEVAKRIHLSEYKRRQAAPILRVSKKSFGIGRKYPLVQRWMFEE